MDEKVVDRPLPADNDETLRKQAVEDLRKRHDLAGHVLAYLTVNTFLVVIWYLTGAEFFWPAFPIFGWGIGIVFHAWDVFWPQPSETAVQAAMDRIARRK
ncbi:2TM domain-containing protein [Kribbella sp. NBC_01510]|uniref:2TM domain-containing protein n=1 Tax=unclassified Kribbella TaxID=2644121 RepID=UPI002E329DB4|nr:2TM domain-containing protein [Kribbella sp. NBC_01484]